MLEICKRWPLENNDGTPALTRCKVELANCVDNLVQSSLFVGFAQLGLFAILE